MTTPSRPEVFSDARDSDLTNLAGEGRIRDHPPRVALGRALAGLSEAVEQLWSKLRFSEASTQGESAQTWSTQLGRSRARPRL